MRNELMMENYRCVRLCSRVVFWNTFVRASTRFCMLLLAFSMSLRRPALLQRRPFATHRNPLDQPSVPRLNELDGGDASKQQSRLARWITGQRTNVLSTWSRFRVG